MSDPTDNQIRFDEVENEIEALSETEENLQMAVSSLREWMCGGWDVDWGDIAPALDRIDFDKASRKAERLLETVTEQMQQLEQKRTEIERDMAEA